MRKIQLFLLFILTCININAQEIPVSTSLIYKGNTYASFTDLTYYHGGYYCVFREAQSHVDWMGKDNGVIKVMKSKDCKKWDSIWTFTYKGRDLRDPSIIVTPEDKLMVLIQQSKHEGINKLTYHASYISYYDKENNSFSDMLPVVFDKGWKDNNILWSVKTIGDKVYGFTYGPKYALVSSHNGIDFTVNEEFILSGDPNETNIVEKDGEFIVIARRDGNNALLGRYTNKEWVWHDAGCKIGGPNIINYKDFVLVCGRKYGLKGNVTSLYYIDKNNKLSTIVDLPSYGDCSYPGMVIRKGKLFISHYHTNEEGGSSIYLSTIELKKLNKFLNNVK